MEDDRSILTTQETAQQKLVYITNLEEDSQNYAMELNEEEGRKDKNSPTKNRVLEKPSLINLSHGSKIYKETGNDNNNAEENEWKRTGRI